MHRELLLAITVTVDEHGQVAIAEGRLVTGNRIERDAGIGNDLAAIGARYLEMLFEPLGLDAFRFHVRRGRADLVLRFQVDPLRLEGAVIVPRIDIEFGQMLVRVLGPAIAPFLKQVGAVPVAVLLTETPPNRATMNNDLQATITATIARAPEWIRQELLSKEKATRVRAVEALAPMIAGALQQDNGNPPER